MASDPRVEQLLDEWEKLRESDPQLTPTQFIKRHMGRGDNEVIRRFQRKAEKLASFDRLMQQVVGSLSTSGQIPDRSDGDLRLSDLRPGFDPIPNYRLVSRLGSGGFGEVWKAEAPGGFHVALKFVQLGGRAAEVEERSLDVIKNVRHPHLLSVSGTWRIGEQLIIATELADCTLLDRLHQAQREGHEGIPIRELLRYFVEAAKGIDALNDPRDSGRIPIQHRDIKPQNLLISGGSVKVGDYGLARSVHTDATGHSGGLTFAYAAPECFAGTTSRRSDQYSLAITYCQLRGGRLPFEGSPIEMMMGHRKREPDLSMLSAEERPAVAKALSKQPRDRWSSCRKFIGTLVKATAVIRHAEFDSVQNSRLSRHGVSSHLNQAKVARSSAGVSSLDVETRNVAELPTENTRPVPVFKRFLRIPWKGLAWLCSGLLFLAIDFARISYLHYGLSFLGDFFSYAGILFLLPILPCVAFAGLASLCRCSAVSDSARRLAFWGRLLCILGFTLFFFTP